MKKYTVYLSTGERVCVEADYFDVNFTTQQVFFPQMVKLWQFLTSTTFKALVVCLFPLIKTHKNR